jgi:hypothetical protein
VNGKNYLGIMFSSHNIKFNVNLINLIVNGKNYLGIMFSSHNIKEEISEKLIR